ncbi:MAG: fatty acid hydroxylase family protein, partial [Proteobacteria bacterium]
NLIVGVFPYWYHTKLINRLPVLEWLIVTPSHHRVHHGKNPSYLDKNFGAVFSFWDRIFGTFAREHESVQYGVIEKLPYHSIKDGYFLKYRLLIATARLHSGLRSRLKVLLGTPESLVIPDSVLKSILGDRKTRLRPHSTLKLVGGTLVALATIGLWVGKIPFDLQTNGLNARVLIGVLSSIALSVWVSALISENAELETLHQSLFIGTEHDPSLSEPERLPLAQV